MKGVEVLMKYGMFRLNDLHTISGKGMEFHPRAFINSAAGRELLLPLSFSAWQTKKGRYGGFYGEKVVALAYAEWLSVDLFVKFHDQMKEPLIRKKTSSLSSFENPLVPVTRLCELHAEQYYWDKKSPQQLNLILAALGYQRKGKPFEGGHGITINQWEITPAGAKFGAEFATLHGQRYIRWSTSILDKIKRG